MCPGFPQKTISFNACFHDLANGSQIHCYAPMGLDIKQKWTVGGNAPGEPVQPTEIGIGAPVTGLYIREDVELKCNFLAAKFVRRTLKSALKVLVARLLVKAQLLEAAGSNQRLRIAQATVGSNNDAYKYSEYRNSEYRNSEYRNSEYRNSEYRNVEHRNSVYGYSSPPVSPTLVSPMSTGSIESRFPLHMENITSTHFPTSSYRKPEACYQIKHNYKPELCISPTENMMPVELP
ncbi:hypothetical protein BGHDH14_bgh04767 [Blumeria hordei DH14]|uniref:DUF7053 domain-containing protein n=1 Tax=Blumeria graminis f. sp. hordei (strain DH14) TaxID=546991 RepID=N1JJ16_BLUG1|nr:hypothetical protein BGHDH14_bgh04767 [Blumeria hordei DH14]